LFQLAGTIVGAINHGVISPTEANRGYIANVAKFGAMAGNSFVIMLLRLFFFFLTGN
jgi:hypothetical protein